MTLHLFLILLLVGLSSFIAYRFYLIIDTFIKHKEISKNKQRSCKIPRSNLLFYIFCLNQTFEEQQKVVEIIKKIKNIGKNDNKLVINV